MMARTPWWRQAWRVATGTNYVDRPPTPSPVAPRPAVQILGTMMPLGFAAPVVSPGDLDPTLIVDAIRPHLPACCRRERVVVECPPHNPPPESFLWHQEGGGPAGVIRHLAFWANMQPPEIELEDGTIFQPQPGELVWLDNDRVRYRRPARADEHRRFVAKVCCSGR